MIILTNARRPVRRTKPRVAPFGGCLFSDIGEVIIFNLAIAATRGWGGLPVYYYYHYYLFFGTAEAVSRASKTTMRLVYLTAVRLPPPPPKNDNTPVGRGRHPTTLPRPEEEGRRGHSALRAPTRVSLFVISPVTVVRSGVIFVRQPPPEPHPRGRLRTHTRMCRCRTRPRKRGVLERTRRRESEGRAKTDRGSAEHPPCRKRLSRYLFISDSPLHSSTAPHKSTSSLKIQTNGFL